MRTDVLQPEVREAQLLIGGQWTRGVDTFAVLDKFNGATIASCERASKEQVDAARLGFTASQTPFINVVAAEKNLRSVELDYQMARVECDKRRAELDRALGRIPGVEGDVDAAGERP